MLTLLMLGSGGVQMLGLRAEIKKMIKIIIKLIEFFLNPGLFPSQGDQMPQKVFLILTKSMFENTERYIKVIHQKVLPTKSLPKI